MNCSRCAHPNPADAKFCTQCGEPLRSACAHCSAPLPEGAQFCPKCGKAVGAPKPDPAPVLKQYIPAELLAKLEYARTHGGMRGERRVVTVLFCDVKGSTAAAENLDPEEWAEIMNGVFECLIPPVYRYEGTLARLMGDAILAFFGAPIAHEDDPQRATLAALDILQAIGPYRARVTERWGAEINVRVGINTGLVVVGEVGSDLRVEYTALGDAVNLAARMEQTAEPGTIQVSESTHRLIAPLFETTPLGQVEVKGRAEPVRTFRVLRAKAAPGQLRGIAGLDAPLIGRKQPLNRLTKALDQLRSGAGQIVSVSGEAGVGKSRLVTEFKRAALADRDAQILWHEGRSFSYETSTPYAPFVDLLTDIFGITADESDRDAYRRIVQQVEKLLPGRSREIAPYLGSLLQLPLEGEDLEAVRYLTPPHLRANTFRAVVELLALLSERGPVVLVFDDLHWVDATSLELIERVLPLTERSALMVLAIFRSQRQDPSWRLHELAVRDYEHRYAYVQLEPLDTDDTRVLVNTLLHIEGLPERLRGLILQKSEGNPFFVEEVIRSLIDSGAVVRANNVWSATREISDIAVPDTIAGVITARLDRLAEDVRPVLQNAAVIGREFRVDALDAINESGAPLEPALVELQRRGLIREKSRLPQPVFMFKHALTQETAYSTLLLSKRRTLHGKLAGFYEASEPSRAGEIARNYVEARDLPNAVKWLVHAGEQASISYSTTEAIEYFSRALDLGENAQDETLVRRAYEGLAGAYVFGNDPAKAMDVYDRMLSHARTRQDRPMEVSALNKGAFAIGLRLGDLDTARTKLEEAEAIARDCRDSPGLVELHMYHCFINTTTGKFDTAMDHLTQSAKLGEDLGIGPARLFSLAHIASTLTLMRRFDEAWEYAQKARQLATELGNRERLAEMLSFPIPVKHMVDGDLDAALESAHEGIELATSIRSASPESEASLLIALIHQLRGEYEESIRWHRRCAEAGKVAGYTFMEAVGLSGISCDYVYISSENLPAAWEIHERIQDLMGQPLGPAFGGMVWADMGFCRFVAGDLDVADELFLKGLTTPSSPMYLSEPLLLAGRAMVALARSAPDEATELAGKADQVARAAGMRYCMPLTGYVLGAAELAAGRPERSLETLDQALAMAGEMSMRPWVMRAQIARGSAFRALGRLAEADAAERASRDSAEAMAGRFADDKLRDQFLRSLARGQVSGKAT